MATSDSTDFVPSDAHPACPSCESDVFVDCLSYADERYYCNVCSTVFEARESPETWGRP